MEIAVCQSCQVLRRTRPNIVNNVSKANTFATPPGNTLSNLRQPFHLTQKRKHPLQLFPFKSLQRLTGFQIPYDTSAIFGLPSFRGICRRLHVLRYKSFLTHSEIEDAMHLNEIPYKKGHTGYLIDCKQCSNSNDGNSLKFTLFIDMRTGDNVCRSCGVKRDWKILRTIISRCNPDYNATLSPTLFKFNKQNPNENSHWMGSEVLDEPTKLKSSSFFPLRKISPSMLHKFNVRSTIEGDLLFPYFNITGHHMIGFKIISSASESVVVKESEFLSLFGWHLIKHEDKRVVLTGNELDSIAVTMSTGLPSLSLPLGVSTLPPDCLPFLEQFNEIILWFGDEYRAKENLQHFATKLNLSRCSRVMSYTGAAVVLDEMGGHDVEQYIQNRRGLKHKDIVSSKDLRDELFGALYNAKADSGIPFKRFPILNEYLKGHRRGELTIFTGPTGSGKTTFLSELSLDLCMQGVKTLWGSFEIKNVRLANIMIHQLSGIALENHLDRFPQWSDELEKLPMYFMSYYGSQHTQTVLDTIEYAIYAYDIEHIIIDNMQFMVNINSGDNTFRVMDNAIASFRKCASKHNVHITLVIHPRKEDEGMMLKTSSVYGSAKATQEADNVIILQSLEETSMQITKNRFSGTTGMIPLLFNPSSLCMSGFHRIPETNVPVLPALKPKKFFRNTNVVKKKK